MAADLAASGVDPGVVDDAQLVLAELVGNAVRHGAPLPGGQLDVTWTLRARAVELRVTDGGGGMPCRGAVRDAAESGRGLAIVDAVAAAWGVEHPRGDRTTVWARVDR